MANALGKVCTACGAERKKKGMILYRSTDFMPFCQDFYFCNDDHPNSPKNVLANQGLTELIPFEQAQEAFKGWLDVHHSDPAQVKKIRQMVERPITLRIGSPELAQFLLDIQSEFNMSSLSDAIRYCIQSVKGNRGQFYTDHKVLKEEKVKQENYEKAAVIEPEPKQVEKPAEPKAEPAKQESDFVF